MSQMEISIKMPQGAAQFLERLAYMPSAVEVVTGGISSLILGKSVEGNVSRLHVRFSVQDLVPSAGFLSGTSVFALGTGGVELARAWMKQAGCAENLIHETTTGRVQIESVAVPTYLRFADLAAAHDMRLEMRSYARLLGLDVRHLPSQKVAVYSVGERAVVNAMDLSGVRVITRAEWGRPIIKLEIHLPLYYLQRHGLDELDSWKDGHANKLYQHVFRITVRQMFWFNDKLMHSAPTSAVFARLGVESAAVLRDYISGKHPLTSPRWVPGLSEARKRSALRKLAAEIYQETGYDISIPFEQFRISTHVRLAAQLRYPGDLDIDEIARLDKFALPLPERVLSGADSATSSVYFCRSTWPAVLEALRNRNL